MAEHQKLNTTPPESTVRMAGDPNTARNEGHPQAEKTDPKAINHGPMGMQLPANGEIAGGAVTKEVFAEAGPEADPNHAMRLQALARGSALMTKLGGDGRPTDEWGLVGNCGADNCPGDTWRGHGILIDIKSLEKLRVHDGARLTEGVYANTRNFSHGLMLGDVKENLS